MLSGKDVFAVYANKTDLPENLIASTLRWSKTPIPRSPNLVVPGVNTLSKSYHEFMDDVMRFYAEEHSAYPRIIPETGDQYVTCQGVLASPAGIIPADSRPLIKEKFSSWQNGLEDQLWVRLSKLHRTFAQLKKERITFAEHALYPQWFIKLADRVATVVWPNGSIVTKAGIVIKRESTTGAPHFTRDIL